jgi:excisionase family DNA binding protein
MTNDKTLVKYNLTPKDVAEMYAITEDHVRVLARKKQIPSIKIGRARRFNAEELAEAFQKIDPVEKEEALIGDESDWGIDLGI